MDVEDAFVLRAGNDLGRGNDIPQAMGNSWVPGSPRVANWDGS